MSYTVRKKFHNLGKNYYPGDVLPDLDGYPRPESMIRAGYVVEVKEEPKRRGRPKKIVPLVDSTEQEIVVDNSIKAL